MLPKTGLLLESCAVHARPAVWTWSTVVSKATFNLTEMPDSMAGGISGPKAGDSHGHRSCEPSRELSANSSQGTSLAAKSRELSRAVVRARGSWVEGTLSGAPC